MSITTILYNLTIYPLELFFDALYSVAVRATDSPGLAIIALSLAVNILVLPLYRRVDKIQDDAREQELRMKPGMDHIKKTFSGDERFMILQTFYRQNHYKPTSALKGSLSLVLEIPFFIAAYRFLSGLQLLQGVSFGPIRNLGAPDAMFTVAGFAVNVLPILMTLINFISGAIYTKGLSFKSKFQLYAMAVLFLVLLYQSPAGLVFYWTLNNLFSLVKNLIVSLPWFKKRAAAKASLAESQKSAAAVAGNSGAALPRSMTVTESAKADRQVALIFFLGALVLTILVGALAPSAVLAASPAEFINHSHFRHPLLFLAETLPIAAGLFLIWFGIFYYLADNKRRLWFSAGVWLLAIFGIINYMAFGNGFGNMSPELRYDIDITILPRDMLINLAVLVAVGALGLILWKWKKTLIPPILMAGLAAVIVLTVQNGSRINREVDATMASSGQDESIVSLPFSATEKNVVVIMMDRAIGDLIPYLFQEKPELERQFDGFTYYRNTLSFGPFTNLGIPALYGGYEYTPEEINKRTTEPLVKKHNEALRLMPVIFSDAGYDVTIVDQAYANYQFYPDYSIYADHPEFSLYHLATSSRYLFAGPEEADQTLARRTRNFFFYSLFRISPSCLQPFVYNHGLYNSSDANYALRHPTQREADIPETEGIPSGVSYDEQVLESVSTAFGIRLGFMQDYTVLTALPEISDVVQDGPGQFLIFDNESTHEETLLKEPEYIPVYRVDNTEFDAAHEDRFTWNGITIGMEDPYSMAHYHVNMAGLLQLGRWFDWMRENGVYDNTRIIVVSDHGRALGFSPWLILEDGTDTLGFHPLLMVKDFNSTGFTSSYDFMTNADTPSLAFAGLIENPVNPATGKPINMEPKNAPELHVIYSEKWDVLENHGNTFLPGRWYAVHGDIHDADNWRRIPDPNTGDMME